MEFQVLSLLVSNHFGVLTRVTSLFSGRGFNIRSLSVGETDDPSLSRITIMTEGDIRLVEQIRKQLMKLEDVKKVALLPRHGSVGRELLLIKIGCGDSDLPGIERTVGLSGGKILYTDEKCLIAEITGETPFIDNFVQELKGRHVMELSRTGITALQAGEITIHSGSAHDVI